MGENYDTAMGLLGEAADALDAAATACEDEVDASDLSSLADRIRGYLSTSRPTTPLGMPRITSRTTTLPRLGRRPVPGQQTPARPYRLGLTRRPNRTSGRCHAAGLYVDHRIRVVMCRPANRLTWPELRSAT